MLATTDNKPNNSVFFIGQLKLSIIQEHQVLVVSGEKKCVFTLVTDNKSSKSAIGILIQHCREAAGQQPNLIFNCQTKSKHESNPNNSEQNSSPPWGILTPSNLFLLC